MYHTCLYCTKDLGSNDVLETLPIGRRVAFDAAQGRLWVVCRACEKWNLVPFDTRLETIEDCERLFSDARLRFSTDNIGIARLGEGLELVRVGPAQRPEFAAWRYGDQFGRRRRRTAGNILLGATATAAFIAARHALFPIFGASTIGYNVLPQVVGLYHRRRIAARVPERTGIGGVVTRKQITKAQIVTTDSNDWALHLSIFERSRAGFATGLHSRYVELRGAEAVATLGHILPSLNSGGGSRRTVRAAVDLVSDWPDVDRLMAVRPGVAASGQLRPRFDFLRFLEPELRLALEMAAHEDTERAALGGELKLLEREWRKAEELAAIADSLAVSDDVHDQVDKPGM